MVRRPGGLGIRRRVLRERGLAAGDGSTKALHALLDKVLAAGMSPVEVESDLVSLLSLAKRRQERDG